MTTTELKRVIKPNEKQQEAIATLKGQVMLLAGPGTGKTFTVINRIEKMLDEGIKPSSILCLTFSDAATNEMRQRLIKTMGVLGTQVDVYTYHSFCNEIIKEYPEQFSLSAGVSLIDDTQKLELIKQTIDEVNPQYFIPNRGNKYQLAKNFIDHIAHLKSLRISKEDYLKCIDTNPTLLQRINELESEIYEREQNGKTQNKTRRDEIEKIKLNIEKAKELWTIYETYSRLMLDNNLIDFSDMISFVLDAFEEDSVFLKEVSNKYSYFLVDEYQDTNKLQNEIIFNLTDANDEQNLFVVGDDDQTIYGFQGANTDNIENFLTKYPNTKLICLEENNRSTQSILDFSYKVISQDKLRLENNTNFSKKYSISKKLTAKNPKITKKNKKISYLHFGDTLQEFNSITENIQTLIDSENCPKNDLGEKLYSEIAIICKKRQELGTLAELLKGKNIPCQIDEGKSIFNIRSTIFIYFYMKVLCNQDLSKDKFYSLFLDEPFAIDLEDYNTVLKTISFDDNFLEVLKTDKSWKNPEKIQNFIKIYDELKEYAQTNTLRNVVIEIINRTGILATFYKHFQNRTENITGIKKIIDIATNFENTGNARTLAEFIQYLTDCLDNDIDLCIDKTSKQNAVQLTTYHGSKGREFEIVYLPNLTKSNWENFRMAGEYKYITNEVLSKEEAEEKKNSELLKLLFVGITRAKHSLTISFADQNEGKAQQPTKFISELTDQDFDYQQIECDEETFTKEIFRSISRDVFNHQKAFDDYIQTRIEGLKLSPSRLNDYLSCPRKFFYSKILEINVEEANTDSANFGTEIHHLLEISARNAMTTGNYFTLEEAKNQFNKDIETIRFSKPEVKENFIRLGNNAIDLYYPHFIEIPASRLDNIEFSFDGIDIDGNLLTGKIDRIEKNKDGTYELYDYKTGVGSPATQIEIGGNKENYFNQLCFYQYAFEKLTGKKVSQVGIIYIETNKTIYKTLCDEDMTYIEDKIKSTLQNIKARKFNPIKEDNKNGPCKFCPYKFMCRLDLV